VLVVVVVVVLLLLLLLGQARPHSDIGIQS